MTTAKKTTEEAEKKPKAAKAAGAKAPAKHAAPKKAEAAKEVVAAAPAFESSSEESTGIMGAVPVSTEVLPPSKSLPAGEYVYAKGRRKTSVAQARMFPNMNGEIKVNGKPYKTYFTVYDHQEAVTAPLKAVGSMAANVDLKVSGGGMRGQAEAARHSISRALISLNPEYRKTLKKLGFLMRDPREKERKKYGHKKARKSSQWAKR
jgi:small subunit ribosomal protein S9